MVHVQNETASFDFLLCQVITGFPFFHSPTHITLHSCFYCIFGYFKYLLYYYYILLFHIFSPLFKEVLFYFSFCFVIYHSYNNYLDLMDLHVHCQIFITMGVPIIDFLILITVFVINMKSLTSV